MDPALVRIVARKKAFRDCLTPKQREVWDRYLVEPNVSAIARDLGVTRGAVQDRLRHVARLMVRFVRAASEG